MLKGSEVKALQRGLRCLFKTGSLYRIQTPPVLSQGAVFETVRTAVRLKPKLQKTVRSRHYIQALLPLISPTNIHSQCGGHLDYICLVLILKFTQLTKAPGTPGQLVINTYRDSTVAQFNKPCE